MYNQFISYNNIQIIFYLTNQNLYKKRFIGKKKKKPMIEKIFDS